MTAFDNATKFFHSSESGKGWEASQAFVAENASFSGQCEPLLEVKTVQAYCEWTAGLVNVVMPGASYEIHASAYDENTNKAIFFATFKGKHTGEGGPVPPTQKETATEYVYVFTMNKENKIEHMTKIWNAPWALRELGWM